MPRTLPTRYAVSLKIDASRYEILDQRALPSAEHWRDVRSVAAMLDAIRTLTVRGAPLLGVSASLCLAYRAQAGDTPAQLREAAGVLRAARPTAVNLHAALDAMVGALDAQGPEGLIDAAFRWFDDDVAMSEALAEHGAALLDDGDGVITHCNTGALATVGVGTALGVIARAHAQGKRLHVWVDETRPLLQGARLTTWELRRLGIPHTLITDSMAALVLREGLAAKAMVGADRVSRNGDAANKVGTYGLAVQCHFHGARFYVVAPSTTYDGRCASGRDIEIEARDPDEVRGFVSPTAAVRWAPAEVAVMNPAFDVTPARLIDALVFEQGVFAPGAVAAGLGGVLPPAR